MKKIVWIPFFVILMAGVTVAYANAGPDPMHIPDNVEVWQYQGLLCVTDIRADGPHTECYCPCDGCDKPVISQSPEPVTPTAIPTEKPEKEKCNSGRGNASEGDPDCDPGNSGGHNNGGD